MFVSNSAALIISSILLSNTTWADKLASAEIDSATLAANDTKAVGLSDAVEFSETAELTAKLVLTASRADELSLKLDTNIWPAETASEADNPSEIDPGIVFVEDVVSDALEESDI